MVIIASPPEEAEVDEIRLVSVIRTPLVDSRIRKTDVQSDIKTLLLLILGIQSRRPEEGKGKEGGRS
jgi:hypothetical protein